MDREKAPAASVADGSLGIKARSFSVLTEEQIKGRKQAWDRIPMPLYPNKVKKPADANTGEPEGKATRSEAPKDQGDAAAAPKVSPMKLLRKGMALGTVSASARADYDDSKSTGQESGPKTSPQHRFNRMTDMLRRIFEHRHQPDKSGMKEIKNTDVTAPSYPSEGQASGGKPSKQIINVARNDSLFVHDLGTDDEIPIQAGQAAAHGQGETTDPKDGPHYTGQGTGQDTLKGKGRKRNKKNKRVTTATFAPPAGPAAADEKEPAQKAEQVAQDGEPSGLAVDADTRTGSDADSRLLEKTPQLAGEASAPGGQGVEPCRRDARQEADEDKIAGPTTQGQKDQSPVDGSGPHAWTLRPGQCGPRQEYRAEAGGSLRMQKKRRHRPQALDTQSVESHESSGGTTPSSSTSSFELISRDASATNLVRHGLQVADSGAELSSTGLNPRAKAFVSPSLSATDKGASAARGGGSMRGAPGRLPGHQSPSCEDAREASAQEKPGSKQAAEYRVEAEASDCGAKETAASQLDTADASKTATSSRGEGKKPDGPPASAKEMPRNKKKLDVQEWPSLPSPGLFSPTPTAGPGASSAKGKEKAVHEDGPGSSGPQPPVTGEAGHGQAGGSQAGAVGGVDG